MTTNLRFHPRMYARTVLTGAFMAALLLFGCQEGSTAGTPGVPVAGAKIDFQLQTLEGRPMGPASFPGQVVVVDFWATWCGPCHIQARILEDVYKDYRGKGVQFIAANVGEQTETVRRFVKEKPFPYTVLIDPHDVAGQLGISALPTLMVIDKKGKLAFFEAGLTDGDTIRRILRQAGA